MVQTGHETKLPSVTRHSQLAVASFACPIVAFCATLGYQQVVHGNFWRSLTPDDNAAGAMMAAGEIIELILTTTVGCLLGLFFAALRLHSRRHLDGLSLAALILNGLPFAFLLAIWIKGMTRGL